MSLYRRSTKIDAEHGIRKVQHNFELPDNGDMGVAALAALIIAFATWAVCVGIHNEHACHEQIQIAQGATCSNGSKVSVEIVAGQYVTKCICP